MTYNINIEFIPIYAILILAKSLNGVISPAVVPYSERRWSLWNTY